MSETSIGIFGIGLLGAAMAHRLLAEGFSVVGWDVDADRRRTLAEMGGRPADREEDVWHQTKIRLAALPTSREVEEVLARADQERRAEGVFVNHTTGSPADAIQFAESYFADASNYVEATILGSSEETRRHEAMALVAGDQVAVSSIRAVLEAIVGQWFDLGAVGQASKMKLVANLVLGLHRAVLAEGFHLAEAFGLDLAMVLEVLRSGATYSRVMDAKGTKMIERDFAPQARLAQHAKDVRIILQEAADRNTELPFSKLHRQLLQLLIDQGLGDRDNSVIFEAFRKAPRDGGQDEA